MNFKNYLDGAGSIRLFPPRREYKLDFTRSQAIIEGRIALEGISVDEAFRRELAAQQRAFLEFMCGQLAMFILACAGLLGTLYLAVHHYPTWVALLPHAVGFGTLIAAQIRYDRVLASKDTD